MDIMNKYLGIILHCLIVTEITIIGAFVMFTYAFPIWLGFVIWAGVVAILFIYAITFGGVMGDTEPNAVSYIVLLNGGLLNFGGYIMLMVILRVGYGFPFTIGGV